MMSGHVCDMSIWMEHVGSGKQGIKKVNINKYLQVFVTFWCYF